MPAADVHFSGIKDDYKGFCEKLWFRNFFKLRTLLFGA